MSYLDEVATAIRDLVPPELVPTQNTTQLFRLYALLALVKGTDVTAADVHDAWVTWMLDTNAGHASIKPFDELDPDVQAADEPFVEAIRTIAADRRR